MSTALMTMIVATSMIITVKAFGSGQAFWTDQLTN